MFAANMRGARAQGQRSPASSGLLDFRYVIPLGPRRIGVLAEDGVVVVEEPETAQARLNLPRATPGTAQKKRHARDRPQR
jgi:hypothetical protein